MANKLPASTSWEEPETKEEDVLEEALRLTGGDRNEDYGHPFDDFTKTAQMWSGYLGMKIGPRDVALMMIMVKASREKNKTKRDNWTDIAGYARCGYLCSEREAENDK